MDLSNLLQLSQLGPRVFARYKAIITPYQIEIVQSAKAAANHAMDEAMLKSLGEEVDEFESSRAPASKEEPPKKRKRRTNTLDNRGGQAGRGERGGRGEARRGG